LSSLDPDKLTADSEAKLLKAFQRAARSVPAYRKVLSQYGVDPDTICTVADFREKVPIIDKSVFVENELRDLCVGGPDDVSLFYSSSGHSGVFSFAVETRRDTKRIAHGIEFIWQQAFGVLDRKTLLINCLPMGVKIPSWNLPLAETSLRADVIWSLVKKLRHDFDQFVLIGEQLFIKKAIEEGIDHGVPWKDILVHVATGAEYIPENYRKYIASLLGMDLNDPGTGAIWVNFGLSELTLTVFCEFSTMAAIRRLAHEDRAFRKALCDCDSWFAPHVMQYFPDRTYIEVVPKGEDIGELVVSILNPDAKIPLMRYNTHDLVRLMSYRHLCEVLREAGRESLAPTFKLPVGILWGRHKGLVSAEGVEVFPNQIKEAIYDDFYLAGRLTGNFRLEQQGGVDRVLFQLRKGVEADNGFCARLGRSLAAYGAAGVAPKPVAYERFPYGLEHDYERKVRYV